MDTKKEIQELREIALDLVGGLKGLDVGGLQKIALDIENRMNILKEYIDKRFIRLERAVNDIDRRHERNDEYAREQNELN